MVYAVGAVVLLASPQWRNVAFAMVALCHSIEAGPDRHFRQPWTCSPRRLSGWDSRIRVGCDLLITSTVAILAALHPRPLPRWPW